MIIARFCSSGPASSIVLYDALAVERDPGGTAREEFTAGRLHPRSGDSRQPPRFSADYTTVRAWLVLEGVPEEWADRALRSLRAGSLPFTRTEASSVTTHRGSF